MEHEFKRRGHSWRVQSGGGKNAQDFDEIVVVHGLPTAAGRKECGLVLHAEAMGDKSWFIDVAGLCLWVFTGPDGVARISGSEDRRPCASRLPPGELRDPALDRPKRRNRAR